MENPAEINYNCSDAGIFNCFHYKFKYKINSLLKNGNQLNI